MMNLTKLQNYRITELQDHGIWVAEYFVNKSCFYFGIKFRKMYRSHWIIGERIKGLKGFKSLNLGEK
jgi:hypothetical protein